MIWESTITLALSVFAASLSAFLGLIKYIEYRRTHISLKASLTSRSLPHLGNSVLVMNESTLPVCIYHLEIVARKGIMGKSATLFDNDGDYMVRKIDALSAQEFMFAEQDHFNVPSKLGTIFIKDRKSVV